MLKTVGSEAGPSISPMGMTFTWYLVSGEKFSPSMGIVMKAGLVSSAPGGAEYLSSFHSESSEGGSSVVYFTMKSSIDFDGSSGSGGGSKEMATVLLSCTVTSTLSTAAGATHISERRKGRPSGRVRIFCGSDTTPGPRSLTACTVKA